jgi:1,4-dihydroxy-2-naphthoate polyprenyltransferase
MKKSRPSPILGPMRPRFLLLTPACVLLGAATATWSGAELNPVYLALALAGALCAHISVNALNEYEDFKSGLDFTTDRTPFSGGTGTLQVLPEKAGHALATGLISLAITALIGIYFLSVRGGWLLPIGILGLANIALYTRWVTRSPLICLVSPGLGFGPFMVMGTHFVLTGAYSWTAFVASIVPFFLVSDLLLLNQFPDVEADTAIGRRHLPITIGRQASVVVYGLFLLGAYAAVAVGWLTNLLPGAGLMAFATIVVAVPTLRGVARNANDIPKLIPYMGKNVLINIATPVFLAIGLFIG